MTVTELAGTLGRVLDSDMKLRAVSTRVLLRTGINLRQPSAEHEKDPQAVGKARAALADMGYRI